MLDPVVAVILAGGLGTRIRSLLPQQVPKPLAPVAGKPFLGWLLQLLYRQGFNQSLIATGYLAEVIEHYIQTQAIAELPHCHLQCLAEPEPLGTAGGFVHAVRHSGLKARAWLVLNGDSITVTDYGILLDYLTDAQTDGVILGVMVADAARYGSLRYDEQGYLLEFAEKRPGAGVINSGVYLLRDELLGELPASAHLSFEYDVFPHWLACHKRFRVHLVEAPFLDIGTPATLAQAQDFIAAHLQTW
jgi:D-glycero-alpha-D-manno-heptose 1-phosphate guanylyltransferase